MDANFRDRTLARRDDAADGVTTGQQDAPTVDLAWNRAWRVEIGARLGNQLAAAGRADGQACAFGDLGVALAADLDHRPRINPGANPELKL